MRPFRMFFGLAIGLVLIFFLARVFLFAFVIAAVMSIIYAVFRRIKDFITYDRYGEPYIPEYRQQTANSYNTEDEIEPLFYNDPYRSRERINNIQFVEIN